MLQIEDINTIIVDFEERLYQNQNNSVLKSDKTNLTLNLLRSEFQEITRSIYTLEQKCVSDFLKNGEYKKKIVSMLNSLVHRLKIVSQLLDRGVNKSPMNKRLQYYRDAVMMGL